MTEQPDMSRTDLWRRGLIRGAVFAVAFFAAFEGMRALGVGVRLSSLQVALTGLVGGAAWAGMYAGLRLYLKSMMSKLSASAGKAPGE